MDVHANLQHEKWLRHLDSNKGPKDYESSALGHLSYVARIELVGVVGLEPTTLHLKGGYSNQLS